MGSFNVIHTIVLSYYYIQLKDLRYQKMQTQKLVNSFNSSILSGKGLHKEYRATTNQK